MFSGQPKFGEFFIIVQGVDYIVHVHKHLVNYNDVDFHLNYQRVSIEQGVVWEVVVCEHNGFPSRLFSLVEVRWPPPPPHT